jgi:hypothetical protein
MKINFIKPLIYGTWILRSTNNCDLQNESNFVIVNNDKQIKLKSYYNYNNIIGLKKSKTAIVNDLIEKNNSLFVNYTWISKNTYTYSILGIEIPEIKTMSDNYSQEKNLSLELYNNVLVVNDLNNSFYYIFDLYQGKIKNPNVETSLSLFIFTQFFSIIFGILIHNFIN